MKKSILVLPVLATLALAPLAQAGEPFRINLPDGYGAFTTQAQTIASEHGDIRATNWISRAPSGEAVVVTVSRMPARILDPDKLIVSTRDSLLKSLSATLELQDARAGDLPSARLLFRSDKAYFQSELMVDGDRIFQVLYVGRSAEQRRAPAVGQMFASFGVVAETPSAAAPVPAGLR
jgi:hypothetical protein